MHCAILTSRWRYVLCLIIAVVLELQGCAIYRGVDFGHWAGRPEKRTLTHVFNQKQTRIPTNEEFVLILFPMGNIQDEYRSSLHTCIFKEAQQNTPGKVTMLEIDRHLAEYVNEKNLVPTPGLFDFQEVGRVGQILGASHVVCVWVNKARFCVPQDLELYFAVVESGDGKVVAEMNGQFDASEQEVSMAMNDYLQACRARQFDRTNLDFIQKSPLEYQAFVAHECMKALLSGLWKKT